MCSLLDPAAQAIIIQNQENYEKPLSSYGQPLQMRLPWHALQPPHPSCAIFSSTSTPVPSTTNVTMWYTIQKRHSKGKSTYIRLPSTHKCAVQRGGSEKVRQQILRRIGGTRLLVWTGGVCQIGHHRTCGLGRTRGCESSWKGCCSDCEVSWV